MAKRYLLSRCPSYNEKSDEIHSFVKRLCLSW